MPSDSVPDQPKASETSLESSAELLSMRAYSAGFASNEERTDMVPAQIAVFTDGVVMADVGVTPEVRRTAIQLSENELADLTRVFRKAEPEGYFEPYDAGFHSSDTMTIIQVRGATGGIIDIAVPGLFAAAIEPPPEVTPAWVAELDREMSRLVELVRDRGGVEFTGSVPAAPGILPP
jgi:hypothetical protein